MAIFLAVRLENNKGSYDKVARQQQAWRWTHRYGKIPDKELTSHCLNKGAQSPLFLVECSVGSWSAERATYLLINQRFSVANVA